MLSLNSIKMWYNYCDTIQPPLQFTPPRPQLQNFVHLSEYTVQLHLLVIHLSLADLHAHFINFSTKSGATAVLSGVMIGINWFPTINHQNRLTWTESSGCPLSAFSHIFNWQMALFTCSLDLSSMGGRCSNGGHSLLAPPINFTQYLYLKSFIVPYGVLPLHLDIKLPHLVYTSSELLFLMSPRKFKCSSLSFCSTDNGFSFPMLKR